MSRLYVGNLSRETSEESLRALLAQDGRTVTAVMLKKNATSGKPRGFAFVDMGSDDEAQAAISALQGATLDGNAIKVGTAKELPAPRGSSWRGSDRGGDRRGGRY